MGGRGIVFQAVHAVWIERPPTPTRALQKPTVSQFKNSAKKTKHVYLVVN